MYPRRTLQKENHSIERGQKSAEETELLSSRVPPRLPPPTEGRLGPWCSAAHLATEAASLGRRRYCVCMSQSLPVSRSTLDMCSAYTVAALGSSCLVAARLDSMLTVSIARPAWEGQSRLAKAVLECVILAVSAPCLTQASRPPPSPPRSGCLLPARLTSPPLARTAGTGPACTAQGWSANGSIIREDRR